MAFQLEKSGTANAVKTAVAALTGNNATETTMLGVVIKMVIDQINAIGGPYFYVYIAGVYQTNTAQRLTTIVEPVSAVLADGSFPVNTPPQQD